jgi:hypothetical protein
MYKVRYDYLQRGILNMNNSRAGVRERCVGIWVEGPADRPYTSLAFSIPCGPRENPHSHSGKLGESYT